jgi:uncharacterized membrane protein HdeD (DUF308 family)
MSAGLARNWWVVGLRAAAATLFEIAVLSLPSPTLASLVLMFAAYVAADGAFAILAGMRAEKRGVRSPMLILEGATNIAVAAAVLVWQAVAVVPLVEITSAWAVITGALLLAAAHRLSGSHGCWVLVLAGAVSATWGILAAVVGIADTRTTGLWLVGYAIIFGGVLWGLASRLRRDRSSSIRTLSNPGISDG